MKKLKIHVIAEEFVGEANGVTTAILELLAGLEKDTFYELVDNIEDADVIHAHTIGLEYIKQSFKYKSKMIVSAHVVPDSFIGSLILSELWRPIAKWYLKFAYNRSKSVIAVSPFVKDELQSIGVKSEINVLCNSVDREKFVFNESERLRLRQKHQVENKFIVVCAGQIQPRKGIYDFIETARKCPNVTFVWVGGFPFKRLTADYDKLQSVVKSAPKNIIFTGIVDFKEMPSYYTMADAFFMPSYQETFGYATIEAASCRCPVLLRDNVEYKDFFFNHYLKGQTPDDFAQILTKLKDDSDFYSHWQDESEVLATRYSQKEYMKQLKTLYLDLLPNRAE